DERQTSSDRIATGGPFGRVSASSNTRPRDGLTPSTLNSSAVAIPEATRRGRSGAVRLACPVVNAPTAANDFARSWNSRYSGGEIQNWSNPMFGNWLEM